MKVLTYALLLLVLTGCAAIITGTHQDVCFNSRPPGATVQVDGLTATTPCMLHLKRKWGGYQVRFHRDGYVDQVVPLGTSFNGWVCGNLIIGGLLGLIIDAASGACLWLDQDNITVTLERISS